MGLRFRLHAATSNAGNRVELPDAGVVCIVGGNNAGKSQILRDIYQFLSTTTSRTVTLHDVEVGKSGTIDDIADYLEAHAAKRVDHPGAPPYYLSARGNQLRLEHFISFWEAQGSTLHGAADFLCWHATAGSLVSAATGTISPGMDTMHQSPLSQLYRYGELEEELSNLSIESFGQPLTLDRLQDFRLRVGDPGVEPPMLNRPTREYADAVATLSPLDHQGDGMKAFIGLALNVIAGPEQLLLVDEPEAFLHPAQARALGRWLADQARRRDKQILLATHDRDLVLGLLDSPSPVKMMRVLRDDTRTTLRELTEHQLATVWNDPVLKYSNVLQGLFHQRVVICEADADCRFYSAVLDTLATEGGKRSLADDTLFVPSGGKQRVATLARALSALGVTVFAVPDFDILRSKSDIKSLLEAVGGTWTSEINTLYMTVARSVPDQGGWDRLKRQGLHGLSSGPVFQAGSELLEKLAIAGVRVVPLGEMEDFDKSIGHHGSAWVNELFAREGHRTSFAARNFMAPLLQGENKQQ